MLIGKPSGIITGIWKPFKNTADIVLHGSA
jgi:hypothetical protein